MPVTTVITNLCNGTGYIYEKNAANNNINTYVNKPDVVSRLLVKAYSERVLYVSVSPTENFYSNLYGAKWYFNDSGSAPFGDVTDALEVTDIFILDTKNPVVPLTVATDTITIDRTSRVMVLGLTPESGTSDTVKQALGNFVVGDIYIIFPREVSGDDVNTIIIENSEAGVDNNFKLVNDQDIILHGHGNVAMFVAGQDFLKELTRPAETSLTVATKILAAGGGTHYLINPSGTAGQTISSKRGLVILNGSGNTLSSSWLIRGENGGDTVVSSHGTTFYIMLINNLITDDTTTKVLDIFGVIINPVLTRNSAFLALVEYDTQASVWRVNVISKEIAEGTVDFADIATPNGTNCSASTGTAFRVPAANDGCYGMICFNGQLTMGVTLAQGAGAKIMYSALKATWKPDATKTYYFLCPVIDGTGVGIKNCIISITAATILVYATAGNALAIDDIIDLSPVKYLAEA